MTNVYLDASAFIPLFVHDEFTTRSRALLLERVDAAVVSDWTIAEAASSFARSMRVGALSRERTVSALAALNSWVTEVGDRIEVKPADVKDADALLRRLDTTLKTPDALHVAIAKRTGLSLVTFDAAMARDARRLGVEVIDA